MKQSLFKLPLWLSVLALSACVKTEIVPETLEPKLSVAPANVTLMPGQTAQLTGIYTDELGESRPDLVQWQSADPAIATVSDAGLLTAVSPGQTWAVAAAPGNLADSTLVTVVQSANTVARVDIVNAPSTLTVGAFVALEARAYNANNQQIAGANIVWTSSNAAVLSVAANGQATALSAGSTIVRASADGISSLPVGIEVVPVGGLSRSGTFSGNMGYSVKGTATLQQSGSNLTLSFGSDFMSSSGPMLGVYLAKNASGSLQPQNSLKLANLISTSGTQTYTVPAGVGLNDYDYVVIYCIPFTVRFGTAQLN